jgi:curved DNA-binding protein CbpA
MTHYRTLGVEENATPEEIKAAFRRAAARAHPDRHGGDDKAMAAINVAYAVLSDPAKRKRYDAAGMVDGPTREEMAEKMLDQLFERAVDTADDVLAFALNKFQVFREDVAEKKRNNAARLDRLRKQVGKVKRKQGRNMVEAIIQRKIAAIELDLLHIAEAEAVHAIAAEMLESYEGPPPPRPAPADLTMAQLAARSFQSAARFGR